MRFPWYDHANCLEEEYHVGSDPRNRRGAHREADSIQARESLERISEILTSDMSDLSFRIQNGTSNAAADIILPASVLRLLKGISSRKRAQGHGVALLPGSRRNWTTQRAADLLNVSEAIPDPFAGRQKNSVPLGRSAPACSILMICWPTNARITKSRRRVADELAADGQELGMGY